MGWSGVDWVGKGGVGWGEDVKSGLDCDWG